MFEKNNFKFKSTVSFLVLLSFFILASSGIVLYFKPEGSIARWTGWTLLGMDKEGWEGIHILFSLLFILSVILHLLYNWRILTGYIFNKVSKGLYLKREIAAALIISSVFLFFAIIRIQPLQSILECRAIVKKGRHIIKAAPPVQDFDKLSLSDAAEVLNISLDDITRIIRLKDYNIEKTDITLHKLAENNNVSPEKLYMEILENIESGKND